MLKQVDLWLTKIINMLMVIMIFAASVIMFLNVVLRYVFKSGYNGTFELVSLLIVSVTFIGGSLLIVDKEHLTMDAVVTVVPDLVKRIFEVIVSVVGIIFSVVLLVYSVKVMQTLSGSVTPVLQLPSSVPFIPIAVGSFITIIKFIILIINQFKRTEG